ELLDQRRGVRDDIDVVGLAVVEQNRDACGAELVRDYSRTAGDDCKHSTRKQGNTGHSLVPADGFRISNVSDAQKLAHSACVSGGAGTMWTALISHIPWRRNLSRTRPSVSVRAASFSAGFNRLRATTSAPASGRPSYVNRTGRS